MLSYSQLPFILLACTLSIHNLIEAQNTTNSNIVTEDNYTQLELCGGGGKFVSLELPCEEPVNGTCLEKISSRYSYSSAEFTFIPDKYIRSWKVEVSVAGLDFNRSIDQDRIRRCPNDSKEMKIRCEDEHLIANESYTLQYLHEFNGQLAGTEGPYSVQVSLKDGYGNLEMCIKFPIDIQYDNGSYVGAPCTEPLSSCAFYDSKCDFDLICRCRFEDYADNVTCKRFIGLVCEEDSDCVPSASCVKVQNKSWKKECRCGFWSKDVDGSRKECGVNLAVILPLSFGVLGGIVISLVMILKKNGVICARSKVNL